MSLTSNKKQSEINGLSKQIDVYFDELDFYRTESSKSLIKRAFIRYFVPKIETIKQTMIKLVRYKWKKK